MITIKISKNEYNTIIKVCEYFNLSIDKLFKKTINALITDRLSFPPGVYYIISDPKFNGRIDHHRAYWLEKSGVKLELNLDRKWIKIRRYILNPNDKCFTFTLFCVNIINYNFREFLRITFNISYNDYSGYYHKIFNNKTPEKIKKENGKNSRFNIGEIIENTKK